MESVFYIRQPQGQLGATKLRGRETRATTGQRDLDPSETLGRTEMDSRRVSEAPICTTCINYEPTLTFSRLLHEEHSDSLSRRTSRQKRDQADAEKGPHEPQELAAAAGKHRVPVGSNGRQRLVTLQK
eukprot:9494718-Pyramimonas_sp.AAC.1